jgi:hypothetical protein
MSSISSTLVNKILGLPKLTGCGFKVTCCVITLAQEDVVLLSTFKWIIQRNWWAHEALQDLTQTIQTRLKLEMMVGIAFCNGRDYGNIVSLGADSMERRNNGNVDV